MPILRIPDGKGGYSEIPALVGPAGKDGAQGLKGDKGDKGDTGAPGKDGTQGLKGDQGVKGDQGLKGDPGTPGLKGDKGDKGDPGADGSKTFDVVEHGTNASAPRPAGVKKVEWRGTVRPENATTYDSWIGV